MSTPAIPAGPASSTPLPQPTADEKTMAFLAQLLQIFTGFIGPLIILLVRSNSRFVKFHALQAILWQCLYTLVFIVLFVALFAGMFASLSAQQPGAARGRNELPPAVFLPFALFWMMLVVMGIGSLILAIVYCIKANQGEWAEYPFIGKLAKRWAGV
jgi:uncharacterized Tic20 family protein